MAEDDQFIAKLEPLSKLSVAGIQQVAKLEGTTKPKALFWLLVFLVSASMMAYQINLSCQYCRTYPTSVDLSNDNPTSATDDSIPHSRSKRSVLWNAQYSCAATPILITKTKYSRSTAQITCDVNCIGIRSCLSYEVIVTSPTQANCYLYANDCRTYLPVVLNPNVTMGRSFAQCDDLSVLNNTKSSLLPPYRENDTVSVSCTNGSFTDDGSTTQANYTCLTNGSSNVALKNCYYPCVVFDPAVTDPNLTTNTTANTTTVPSGTVVLFDCKNSYFLTGDRTTACNSGQWTSPSANFPICLEQLVPYYNATTLGMLGDVSPTDDILAAQDTLLEMLAYLTANMSDSMKYSLGFTKDDLLLACVFNTVICERSFIRLIQNQTNGNCFSFNHKDLAQRLMSSRAGEPNGLQVLFNSMLTEYLSFAPTAGIRLVIHQPLEAVFPDTMGFTIAAGVAYSISLRKRVEIKARTPVNKCYDLSSDSSLYFVQSGVYGVEACLRTYTQQYIMGKCGCGNPYLPYYATNIPLCTLEQRACVQRAMAAITNSSTSALIRSECPSACQTVLEIPTITQSRIIANSPQFLPYNLTTAYVKNNVISAKIFYEDLTYLTLTESVSYTARNLLSDCCSLMGLWIGASVISLVELMVVPFQIIRNFWKGKTTAAE